jgi:hypothetical protein
MDTYENERQGPKVSTSAPTQELREKIMSLLHEFVECGQPLGDKHRAWEITGELHKMGYTIWLGQNEYSAVSNDLTKELFWDKIKDKCQQLVNKEEND